MYKQGMSTIVLVQFLLVGLLCASQAVFAGTFHISPNGNDRNPGTQNRPWKTIAKANKTLKAGDTVLIHAGHYSDQIRPINSGKNNDVRVTYQAAGDGDVILNTFVWHKNYGGKGLIALGGKQYVTVSGRAPGGSDQDRWIKLKPTNKTEVYGNFTGSTGCVVENVIMERGRSGIGPGRGWAFADYWYKGNFESKYNVLRFCEIHGYAQGNNASEYTEDTVTLAKKAHHNLIENCLIGESRHVSLNQNSGTTYKNVFRNNVVKNPEHSAMSEYGLAEKAYRQDHHLIENNILSASGDSVNPRGSPGNALQFAANENIIRYNLITESGSRGDYDKALAGIALSAGNNGPKANDNRIYHNTIVHNLSPAIGLFTFGQGQSKGRNRFWNNLIYDAIHPNGGKLLIRYWRSLDDRKDRWVGNVFGQPAGNKGQRVINLGGTDESVATVELKYRNPSDPEFSGWLGFDNKYDEKLNSSTFINYSGKDYHLKATSPYIDAAAPLTRVADTDSGSGTALKVDDARVFYGEASEFPAWMNINNDWIAIGSDPKNIKSATKVQIFSVDDATNTLVLSQSVSRTAGDSVWLWRDSDGSYLVNGKAPDIGAFESGARVVAPASVGSPKQTTKAAPTPPLIID